MNSLDTDLIEFIRTYRGPYQIYEAAGNLAALGENGGNWPKAEIVWRALGEYDVKHFLIDEEFDTKADNINEEDHGEVAF